MIWIEQMDRKALYRFLSQDGRPRYAFYGHGVGCTQSLPPSSVLTVFGHAGLLDKNSHTVAFTLNHDTGSVKFRFENWEIDEAELVNQELYVPNLDITIRFVRATFSFAPLGPPPR
jgi:hypothetical protein